MSKRLLLFSHFVAFSELVFEKKIEVVRADLSLSKKLCKSYRGGRFGLLK